MNKVQVLGVGMTPFCKPGQAPSYELLAEQAIGLALQDAALEYAAIQQAYASYVYGDSCCGQRALYRVGRTGIPIFNVNNNCSSGSTALFLARQAIASGAIDCALVVGFEVMQPGAISEVWQDRTRPLGWVEDVMDARNVPPGPIALRVFGAAANEYLTRYKVSPEVFYRVAVKNRQHALANECALFDQPLSLEEVAHAPIIFPDALTRLCACPPSCGAAAVVLANEAFAKSQGQSDAVTILAQALTTDQPDSTEDFLRLAGTGMTERAAQSVYSQSGIGPKELDLVELHDCFAPNEVISYEALGLCAPGTATQYVRDGDNTYGGSCVVNPSGGLMSKGHPLGATGVAQSVELTNQLRGRCGARQVPNARLALQHNIGLGGAAVVTLYGV